MIMILISFLICFFASVLVTSILINKKNKTNYEHDADVLNYMQIAHGKNVKRKKQQIYVPPKLAVRLISKYCAAPDGTSINDMLLAEAIVHNMK